MSLVAAATPDSSSSQSFLSIIYGSAAVGYKPDQFENAGNSTHRWTFYIRAGDTGKDLALVVNKVIFRLHPTCTHPLVECTKPPYETSQLGWGEFPCTIEVHFCNEASVSFVHQLRLHATGVPTSKPIISEHYDEVCFNGEQAQSFIDGPLRAYHASHGVQAIGDHAAFAPQWKQFNEANDLVQIAKAHAYIKQELEAAVHEYEQVEREYLQLVQAAPQAHPAAAAAAAVNLPPAVHAFLDDAPPKIYALPAPNAQQQQQQQLQQQQRAAAAAAASSAAQGGNKKDSTQPAKKKGRPTLQENKTKPATAKKPSAAAAGGGTAAAAPKTKAAAAQPKPRATAIPMPAGFTFPAVISPPPPAAALPQPKPPL